VPDSIVCLRCGVVVPFEEPRFESLREKVAGTFGFRVESHRLELYGLCSACRRGRPRH
jgi:Fur family ferric uptake transcriptional regulator